MAAHTFTGSLGGTFTAGVGVITPSQESQTQVQPIVATLECHARLSLAIPAPHEAALDLRTVPGISLAMPVPAVLHGVPRLPKHWGKLSFTGRGLSGVGHLRAFDDPDPVWDGLGWTVAPPVAPSGAHFLRWTAKSLPNPAGYPGGFYSLGTPSASDGTLGIAAGAQQWAAAPGSSYPIPWQSRWPFKPTVRNHVHYGRDGSSVTIDAGVHFAAAHVQHMWADFGTILSPPFTLMIVAVITDFSTPNYWNYIFDAGEDPTPDLSAAQMADIGLHGVSGDIALTEAYGYRTGLRVGRSQLQAFNDPIPTTRLARFGFVHTVKPKLLSLTVNGSKSYLFSRDVLGPGGQGFTLANHGAQRLVVMGRANNVLSALAAASMVVFEVRAWDAYLTYAQLQTQYAQLSSTWRFHLYR